MEEASSGSKMRCEASSLLTFFVSESSQNAFSVYVVSTLLKVAFPYQSLRQLQDRASEFSATCTERRWGGGGLGDKNKTTRREGGGELREARRGQGTL